MSSTTTATQTFYCNLETEQLLQRIGYGTMNAPIKRKLCVREDRETGFLKIIFQSLFHTFNPFLALLVYNLVKDSRHAWSLISAETMI